MQQDTELSDIEHFLQNMPPLRHSGKHLGGLFGAVFGVRAANRSGPRRGGDHRPRRALGSMGMVLSIACHCSLSYRHARVEGGMDSA